MSGKTQQRNFFLAGDLASLAGGRKERGKIGNFTPSRQTSHICPPNLMVLVKTHQQSQHFQTIYLPIPNGN